MTDCRLQMIVKSDAPTVYESAICDLRSPNWIFSQTLSQPAARSSAVLRNPACRPASEAASWASPIGIGPGPRLTTYGAPAEETATGWCELPSAPRDHFPPRLSKTDPVDLRLTPATGTNNRTPFSVFPSCGRFGSRSPPALSLISASSHVHRTHVIRPRLMAHQYPLPAGLHNGAGTARRPSTRLFVQIRLSVWLNGTSITTSVPRRELDASQSDPRPREEHVRQGSAQR
jgi:hypothetical protein